MGSIDWHGKSQLPEHSRHRLQTQSKTETQMTSTQDHTILMDSFWDLHNFSVLLLCTYTCQVLSVVILVQHFGLNYPKCVIVQFNCYYIKIKYP